MGAVELHNAGFAPPPITALSRTVSGVTESAPLGLCSVLGGQ